MGPVSTRYYETSYFCDHCKSNRVLKFNKEIHEGLLNQSKNGLVVYSDVHTCKEGLFEVNNLNVDKDYNIRTYEFIKLPEYRRKEKSLIPVPGTSSGDNAEQVLINITDIGSDEEIHLVIEDHMLNTKIKLGRFDHNQPYEKKLQSEMMGIDLFYYTSNEKVPHMLEQWLKFLIDTLEILPPTKIGLLIETLRYLIDNQNHPISDFDKQFIRTILASHEIYFDINDITLVMNLHQKYLDHFNENDLETIDKFLSLLQENPSMPIQFFTKQHKSDLIYQIYLFLILEKENIIMIERPGIVGSV